jgi:hypothetical protein
VTGWEAEAGVIKCVWTMKWKQEKANRILCEWDKVGNWIEMSQVHFGATDGNCQESLCGRPQ